MGFDGITARSVIKDIEHCLLGARVDKIHMPSPEEVHIYMRSMGRARCLLMNINTANCRVQMTENKAENPKAPLNFCMVLRKYIGGGRLINIEARPYDRVFRFVFEAVTEMGDRTTRSLIAEIMGKHSNIVLINESGTIIDAIKHVDSSVNTFRQVLPMRPYELPPTQEKQSPESADISGIVFDGSTTVRNALIGGIMGVSPLLACEIAFRAGIDPQATVITDGEKDRLQGVLNSLGEQLSSDGFTPCLVKADGRKAAVEYSAIMLTQYGEQAVSVTSLMNAMDAYYHDKDINDRLGSVRGGCARQVRQAITRCANKIKLQEAAISQSADMDDLKRSGDLITASMYMLSGGEEEALLPDYYAAPGPDGQPQMRRVRLDPSLSPQRNAQDYFKKYAKAKRTMATAAEQLEHSRAEMDYLEQAAYMLSQCDSMADVVSIREELMSEGYIRDRRRVPARTAKRQPLEPQRFVYEGYEILVGRNSAVNQHLTLQLASSNDVWLHARNIPGSHVVVRKQQGEIPDSVLEMAASVAAYFSQASDSGKVPVDYTKIKYVRKAKGGRPGMVTYDNFSTAYVTPRLPDQASRDM